MGWWCAGRGDGGWLRLRPTVLVVQRGTVLLGRRLGVCSVCREVVDGPFLLLLLLGAAPAASSFVFGLEVRSGAAFLLGGVLHGFGQIAVGSTTRNLCPACLLNGWSYSLSLSFVGRTAPECPDAALRCATSRGRGYALLPALANRAGRRFFFVPRPRWHGHGDARGVESRRSACVPVCPAPPPQPAERGAVERACMCVCTYTSPRRQRWHEGLPAPVFAVGG